MNTDRSTAPKSASKTDKNQFWRKKKKIAQGHMKTAKATGNGGWVKMLKKRINKYESKISEKRVPIHTFKEFLQEASLAYYQLAKDIGRFKTFADKLSKREPFAMNDPDPTKPGIIIDVDEQWLNKLNDTLSKNQMPDRFTSIPLKSGKLLPLSLFKKTEEFGSRAQGGAKLEDAVYNSLKEVLADGPIKLKIQDDIYEVTQVGEPSKQSNIKSDLTLTTTEGPIFISLKEHRFVSYSGISSRGREYQRDLSQHPYVKRYLSLLKKYLLDNSLCDDSDGKLTCKSRLGEFYYIQPDDPEFNNLVLFGDEKYKNQNDYADYIIKFAPNINDVIVNNGNHYTFNEQAQIIKYGDELAENMKPVFLTRTSRPHITVGIRGIRTMIVPRSEADKRPNAIKLGDGDESNTIF